MLSQLFFLSILERTSKLIRILYLSLEIITIFNSMLNIKGFILRNLRVLNKLIETNEGMQQYNKITHISNEKINETKHSVVFDTTLSI